MAFVNQLVCTAVVEDHMVWKRNERTESGFWLVVFWILGRNRNHHVGEKMLLQQLVLLRPS